MSNVYFSVAVKRATPKGAIMSKRARELGGKGRYREHIGYFGFGVLRSGEERGEDIFSEAGVALRRIRVGERGWSLVPQCTAQSSTHTSCLCVRFQVRGIEVLPF